MSRSITFLAILTLAACGSSSNGSTTAASSAASSGSTASSGASSGAVTSSSSGVSSGSSGTSAAASTSTGASSGASNGTAVGSSSGAATGTNGTSSATSNGTSGGSSGTSGGGNVCTNAACNSITQIGSAVSVTLVASAAPSGQGGSVPADGTYALTADTIYTGVGGQSGAGGTATETYQFSGSGTALNELANDDEAFGCTGPQTQSGSLVFSPSSSSVTFTPSCPSSSKGGTVTYTSTSNTLQLFLPNSQGLTEVKTLTLAE